MRGKLLCAAVGKLTVFATARAVCRKLELEVWCACNVLLLSGSFGDHAAMPLSHVECHQAHLNLAQRICQFGRVNVSRSREERKNRLFYVYYTFSYDLFADLCDDIVEGLGSRALAADDRRICGLKRTCRQVVG